MTSATVRPCRPVVAATGDRAGVVAPPPLIFATGLGAGLLLNFVLPALPFDGVASTIVVSVLAVVAGTLAGAFVLMFRRAGTAIDPGRASTVLVTSGPYRFTRNPGYLGMTLAYLAVAIGAQSIGALLLFVPTMFVVECGVVRREERYLEAKFGDDYRAYRARVRRWL